METKTIDDLPARVQAAVRQAMPVPSASLNSWIDSPLPALGNRSIIAALEEDGYAAESAIIECCHALARIKQETSARGVL